MKNKVGNRLVNALRKTSLAAVIAFGLMGTSIVSAVTPYLPPSISLSTASAAQEEADKALEITLADDDVASILSGKTWELSQTEVYFGAELELTISFPEHFQFRGYEIAQLKVFADTGKETVIGYYLLDKGAETLPAAGRVVLTESQEQRGLEIALADPLVSKFFEGKNYTITRADGMPEWASNDTGKPGVAFTFTLDKEYKFKGDIYHPPYNAEETWHLDGTVKGLDVIANLQWGQVVHMWPHVTTVPMPVGQLLIYAGIIAAALLAGAGIYHGLRRAGYREDKPA